MVGVRGFAADGSRCVLRFERLPGVAQKPGSPFLTRLRVRIEDAEGKVLSEITITEETFVKAVKKLFADEIRVGRERLVAKLKKQPQSKPTQGQPRPAGPTVQGFNLLEVLRFGMDFFAEEIPEPARKIIASVVPGMGGEGEK